MLDLELLNLWINRLNFDIRDGTMYVMLKAFSEDPCHTYVLALSSDRNAILDFLGFDTTRDYDHMTTYNQFEYLCTSTKLDPKYISYFSFKGPAPKTINEAKFEKYLKNKIYPKFRYDENGYTELREATSTLKNDAIRYFKKDGEYKAYLDQKRTLNKLISLKKELEEGKVLYGDFSKFIMLHGIYNVVKWDEETLKSQWKQFKTENWSGLLMFRTG